MRYFLGISKTSTDLQWLKLDSHASDLFVNIPEWVPRQNLHSLRLKGISPARLCERDDQVLLRLKELYCSSFVMGFLDPKLEDMSRSDLNELLASFGRFRNLERLHLDFEYCLSSTDVEWSCLLRYIRELINLQTLELKYFEAEGEFALSNREKATDDQFRMRSLQDIILCNSNTTTKVSISGECCPTLQSLKLCSMEDLTEVDLIGLTTLECLRLLQCRNLREVLGSDLLKLEMFDIRFCCTIKKFPDFRRLSFLKRIYISCCRNLEDISTIETLKGLKRIFIAYCSELKSIKAIEQLKGLKRIWIQECPQLQGGICFKELKELKRIFIAYCASLDNMEGIEFSTCLESIIIVHCPKLKNIGGLEELKGLKEMVISDNPMITCVERLQRLPSELTTMVGRSAMSGFVVNEFPNKIVGTLSMVDYSCEIDWMDFYLDLERQRQIKETINKLSKKNPSLKRFFFCTLVKVYPGPTVTDISQQKKPLSLFRAYGDWVYICVVNEERLSECYSWIESFMNSNYKIEKVVLMGVESTEERKAVRILQSLFAQLSVQNSEYSKEELQKFRRDDALGDHFDHISSFNHINLANDIEEYNGCDDDDDDHDDSS